MEAKDESSGSDSPAEQASSGSEEDSQEELKEYVPSEGSDEEMKEVKIEKKKSKKGKKKPEPEAEAEAEEEKEKVPAQTEGKRENMQDLLSSLGVHSALKKAAASEGLVYPSVLQRQLVPLLLKGEQKHILVKYEDAGGIKLGYLLPILNAILTKKEGEAQRFTVLLAHSKKRMGELEKYAASMTAFCRDAVKVKALIKEDSLSSKDLPHILITNPKVLLPLLADKGVLEAVTCLVIDQADFHLQMEYKEELEKIGKMMEGTGKQIVMTVKSVEDTDAAVQEVKKAFMPAAVVIRFKQAAPLIGMRDDL